MTPKGSQFVEAARRLLAAAEGLRVEVQHINRKVSGNINIGLLAQIDPVANKKIALAIARLRSRHEGLYFHFTELSSSLREEKIINGHIDLAIGYFWHRLPNIDYFALFQETQIAYCAPTHPLFEQVGELTRDDVSDYDWVWPSHPLPEMPAPTSIERLTVLTDSMDGAALLILSGQHLGFLPQHYAAVRHSARQRDVVSAFLTELIERFRAA